ncbi:opacity protein-like surface antigen [Mesocricetibacter intestinalis]|uniref:Opacity protein-like surface antigen n=1 Tax=Mesocricetibacter intestinalis TaxID=1521930 RepID=A0A4R6V836_9PAST|nr:OmpW family outer membrane protein [Mesocricetibacter intestinalis]TDQ57882.1 opacity protein-like surface antigen [Mesocricetibacter intestinalis]
MKKTTLAVLLGTLAVATSANAFWYAQGDLGYSKTKFSAYSALDDSKFDPRISIGYDFGGWRLAADYTHQGKFEGREQREHISAKIYGIGFSGIYDFNMNSAFKPYAGIRIANNIFDIENRGRGYFNSKTENKFGYGVLAGVQYPLTQNWSLNGNVEYNRLGKFEDTKVNQYGAKVGIRYDF